MSNRPNQKQRKTDGKHRPHPGLAAIVRLMARRAAEATAQQEQSPDPSREERHDD